jgi:cobalamin biosynthesis protein CobD/CbiB
LIFLILRFNPLLLQLHSAPETFQEKMTSELLFGSLALSLLHGAIPNHWLPIVAIGKRQGWTAGKASRITLMAGSAHAISTVLIGLIVSFTGWQLASWTEKLTINPISTVLIA